MKTIKYLLFGLGGLLGLVLIAGAVFALTFDPNRYKPEIERLVKQRTERTLRLAGDLEVAFWPSLGAKVAGVTLSERGDRGEFVALESAHASVAVLPLLRGAVVVDAVRVSGLKAKVVKGKDGRFNFQDLLEAGGAKPAAGATAPARAAPIAFDIAAIQIERAAVSYRDLASGQELALDNLQLRTGRIADGAQGRLELSTRATGRKPALEARLTLAADYRLALAAQSATLSGLSMELKGMVEKDQLEAALKVPQAEVSARALSMPRLAAELGFSGPSVPQKSVKLALDGSLRADLEKETAAAELKTRFDESTIQAKLGLARFAPPRYSFDVTVDRLNLDQYFPPQKKAAAPGKPASAAPAETPVDLSALKGLDASGRIALGSLQVQGVKLANVKAEVRAANGRMDIAPHSADLYEGTVSGALALQAQGNRVALKEKLTGISIGPLLRDAAEVDRLEGRGSVVLDVAAAGKSVEAMKQALAGTARVELRDGAIKGINIAEALRKARTALGSAEPAQATGDAERTDFSELTASFVVKDGVARNEDLEMKAPLFRVAGRGDINIGASRIDYVTKATLVATSKGQGGAERAQLSGLTVPVRLTGPFDDMKYKVDYGAAAADLAKSKAGAKLQEKVEGRREKVEEKLGDKLRGLLRR